MNNIECIKKTRQKINKSMYLYINMGLANRCPKGNG